MASECRLFWNAGDLVTMDRIKDAGSLSAAGRQAYEAGVTLMQVRGNVCESVGGTQSTPTIHTYHPL